MQCIGPRLEQLLLSGEAVYKNAPLGYGALVALQVPSGKSFIITKINIQPFFNIIDYNLQVCPTIDNTIFGTVTAGDFRETLTRLEYSFLVYNERISNRWQLRNSFGLENVTVPIFGAPIETNPSILLEEKNIDCFILIEETTFFFFSYPSYQSLQYGFQLNDLQTVFLRYNSFPEGPAGYEQNFQTVEAVVIPVLGGFTYLPLGIANSNTSYNNTTNVITLPSIAANSGTQIVFPYPNSVQTVAEALYQPSLPLFNVEYIEINKRTTTKGIKDGI
jgi:hypothetical protein